MNADGNKRLEPCKRHSWGFGAVLPDGKGSLRLCRYCAWGQHRPANAVVGFRTITPDEVKRYMK